MKTHAIFLRGVTPTGKNRVPMAELRVVLAKAGLHDVRTYIQSGNVVAGSQLDQDSIQSLVHDAIAQEIGADFHLTESKSSALLSIRCTQRNTVTRSSTTTFSNES